MSVLFHPGADSGATISFCVLYRYDLWRIWEAEKPRVLWLMLNPSTAQETVESDDNTVKKITTFTKSWDYGGFHVANLFALRATDPRELYKVADPRGPENDRHILRLAEAAAEIVLGWGAHGGLLGRSAEVHALLRPWAAKCVYLAKCKGGEPGHPLFLKGTSVRQSWKWGGK